jgi:uncharacterized small protein (DUF1192 family)
MSKVLKITKPDKTIHVSPIGNKARLHALNRILPADQKWKFEEITEDEAKKLPWRDENYVTGAEAQLKVSEMEKTMADKDAEIEALKAQLAAKAGGNEGQITPPKATAEEVIALVNAATSIEQVESLVKDDTRVTVMKAGEKKIAAIKEANAN